MKWIIRTLIALLICPVFVLGQQGTTVIKSGSGGNTATVDSGHNLLVRGSPDTPCYINGGVGTTAAVASANCKASAGTFLGIRAVNTSGTLAYVRMYNLATSPTCSSATGFVEAIPVPANTTGAGIVDLLSNFAYSAGVGYCITGAGTSTDTSAPPAGVFITISFN